MRYVALLRGINVGGKNMIKMAELRTMFEALGFSAVATYVNSGNIAFDAPGAANPDKLRSKIKAAVSERFGLTIPVVIRKQSEIAKIVTAAPFADRTEDPKLVHIVFIDSELTDDHITKLRDASSAGEEFARVGRDLAAYLPRGVLDSVLGRSFLENKLKLQVTARNWRTVKAIAEL